MAEYNADGEVMLAEDCNVEVRDEEASGYDPGNFSDTDSYLKFVNFIVFVVVMKQRQLENNNTADFQYKYSFLNLSFTYRHFYELLRFTI